MLYFYLSVVRTLKRHHSLNLNVDKLHYDGDSHRRRQSEMASSAILRVPWNKAERRRNTANTPTLLEGSNYCSNVSRTHRCRRRRRRCRCRTSSKNDLHVGNSSGRREGRKKHPAPGDDNSDDSLVDTGLRGTKAGSDATWTTILPPPPSTRCRRRSWRCCQRRSSRH